MGKRQGFSAKRMCGALSGLVLLGPAAQAQTPAPDISPLFRSVLTAPQHVKAAVEAAKHSTTWLRHGCATATLTRAPEVRVWRRPEFDPSNRPIAGEWGERFEATGCGVTRTLNVVTSVRSPGALVSGPLAPGDTPADPILQLDASRYVFAAALPRVPGCKQAYLDDTKVDQEPGPDESVRVEDWRIVACESVVNVEVSFRASATGTDIVARVR